MVAVCYKGCLLIMKVAEKRIVSKGRGRKTRVKTVWRWKPVKVMRPTNVGEYPPVDIPIRDSRRIKITKVTPQE